MQRRKLIGNGLLLVAGIASGALAGCVRTAPIYTAQNVAFRGNAGLAERSLQVKRAGARLEWEMEDVAPDVVRATRNDHSDQAVVDITFDPAHFSIRYVSSKDLRYTGTVIHKNYNDWVQKLEREIVEQSAKT